MFVTRKRHIVAWFRVFWVITRQNRSKGLTCGLFTEKKVYVRMYVRKNNLTLYFTYLPRSPPSKDLHQNWYSGSSRGRNQLWQFFWQSVKGFGFCRGSKFAISHWLSRSPLTQCWRYRAARDNIPRSRPRQGMTGCFRFSFVKNRLIWMKPLSVEQSESVIIVTIFLKILKCADSSVSSNVWMTGWGAIITWITVRINYHIMTRYKHSVQILS